MTVSFIRRGGHSSVTGSILDPGTSSNTMNIAGAGVEGRRGDEGGGSSVTPGIGLDYDCIIH